jgi:S1-C subfamily serine protease
MNKKTLCALLVAAVGTACMQTPKQTPYTIDYDNHSFNVTDDDIELMMNSTAMILQRATYVADDGTEETFEGGGSMLHLANEEGRAYFITSNHIVEQPDQEIGNFFMPRMTLKSYTHILRDGEQDVGLEVLATNEEYDLALVRTDRRYAPQTTPFNHFAKDEEVHEGDVVYSVGQPFFLGLQINRGIVISKETEKRYEDNPLLNNIYWVSSHINPGNSGGPSFVVEDGKPRVVGIGKIRIPQGDGIYGVVRIDKVKEFLHDTGHERFYHE